MKAPTYPLKHAFFCSFVHCFMSSSLNVFAETIDCVKEGMKLNCDVVGFVDSNSGCLVKALEREREGDAAGCFLE